MKIKRLSNQIVIRTAIIMCYIVFSDWFTLEPTMKYIRAVFIVEIYCVMTDKKSVVEPCSGAL